jgi:hypothetical protein
MLSDGEITKNNVGRRKQSGEEREVDWEWLLWMML